MLGLQDAWYKGSSSGVNIYPHPWCKLKSTKTLKEATTPSHTDSGIVPGISTLFLLDSTAVELATTVTQIPWSQDTNSSGCDCGCGVKYRSH